MMNGRKGKDKNHYGDRGHCDQSEVDRTMKLLPGVAVGTLGEMRFIIATHLGSETGDVIAPFCKNITNERINALTHMNL